MATSPPTRQNHASKGSFEPCRIVPAVTEVCLPQAAHSKVKGFPPCGQPLAPAHAGHRNPEGQRAAISQAAQASSSGNWRWNSTSEAGKSGMGGLQANPMFTLCSYLLRPPLSLPIVGPEPEG